RIQLSHHLHHGVFPQRVSGGLRADSGGPTYREKPYTAAPRRAAVPADHFQDCNPVCAPETVRADGSCLFHDWCELLPVHLRYPKQVHHYEPASHKRGRDHLPCWLGVRANHITHLSSLRLTLPWQMACRLSDPSCSYWLPPIRVGKGILNQVSCMNWRRGWWSTSMSW